MTKPKKSTKAKTSKKPSKRKPTKKARERVSLTASTCFS